MKELLFLLFLLLVAIISAQTILQPGTTTFEVSPIIIQPPPIDGTYGGNPNLPSSLLTPEHPLGLQGDLFYLNIIWNVSYADGEERDIGVDCYLNCPNPDEDIDTNCAGYQNCSYVGPTGLAFCTIVNPLYLFKQINNVTCKFYDPLFPTIQYLPYPNRSFRAVDLKVHADVASATVGKPFTLPISITSLGLLASSYTVNVTVVPSLGVNPDNIVIERSLSTTDEISYGEVGIVYPRILFLVSTGEPVTFQILTKSNIEPSPALDTACLLSEDCSQLDQGYGVSCIDSRCWCNYQLQIIAGNASLPDFGLFGLIQIILLAILVLLII